MADQPLWELGVGLAALHLPHYRGSDQTRNWLLPLPYFNYRGEIFRADREGAHAVLVESQRFNLDLSFSANTPVHSQDNRARIGLPDLAPSVEFGPNARYGLVGGKFAGTDWKLDLRLPARTVFTLEGKPKNIGWTVNPTVNLDLSTSGWDVSLQSGPVASSRRYNRYFYSVDAANMAPGRPAYAAAGGRAGWNATALASRRFGDFWLGTYVQYDNLSGAVFEDSPLVRKKETLSYGVGLSWIFAKSSTRVPDSR